MAQSLCLSRCEATDALVACSTEDRSMNDASSELARELLAERALPTDEVWRRAEARLAHPPAEWLNSAEEMCDRWAADRARLAMTFVHPDGRRELWTFAELARVSSRVARALRAAGLQRGDRVAGVMTRQVEAYLTALAAWRNGMIYTPLFVGFGPDALAQRLEKAEVGAVVVDHQARELVEQARAQLSSDPAVITVGGAAGRGVRRGDWSFWAEVDRHAPDGEMVRTDGSEPATLIFTSGTTGPPKGCLQAHWIVLTLQPFLRHTFALQPNDLLFAGADPGWSYGLYTVGFGPMSLGCPRVIYTGDFDARRWLQVIEDEQITYLGAAPSAYRRLADAAKRHGLAESVRGATSAGEPLDATLTDAWRAVGGGELQDGYGQSESAMLLANLAFEPRPLIPGSLSSVVPGFDVALLDPDGNEVEGQGVLAVHRPRYQASVGYFKEPEKWAARWRGDWFLTGDVLRRDEDDRWWFVGRDDDLIVTSGYNVGPTEVENVILEHPEVQEAAVVGAPDPDRGAVVRAVVVLRPTGDPARVREELQQEVRTRIGRHAYPRIVDVVDELPRTETGKLRRTELRNSFDGASGNRVASR
jgi:acetyl-CoA synthetase